MLHGSSVGDEKLFHHVSASGPISKFTSSPSEICETLQCCSCFESDARQVFLARPAHWKQLLLQSHASCDQACKGPPTQRVSLEILRPRQEDVLHGLSSGASQGVGDILHKLKGSLDGGDDCGI